MPNINIYIITGCSSGIGKALCEQLIQNTENFVVGISRNRPFEAENFEFISLDLSNLDSVKSYSFPNLDKYQKITLINNAGMLGEINTLDKIRLDSLENIMNVNYTAAMLLATRFIQKSQMLCSEKMIINISSGAASSPYISWANYCASKAALEMLSRCIALEQASKQFPIRCYSIAPGVVDTAMQKHIRNSSIENFPMLSKFEDLYHENKLYNPVIVAEKIIDVIDHPDQYPDNVFRIQI